MTINKYSKYIDHSLLHPTSTIEDIQKTCSEAIEFNVAAVCVKPDSVKKASELLTKTSIAVATVIGFPHGGSTTETKCFETKNSIKNGANEIDMVVNIGKVLANDWKYVSNEIQKITNICRKHNVLIKVIFETGYITKAHIIELCKICSKIKVDFVKTSTGFDFIKQTQGLYSTKGAQIDDIILIKKNISPSIQIKASGGIRDAKSFLEFINLGVARIGTSATKDILKELK